jgi:cation diffusion facilitator CzcD-associated flavoprotein CzcO
MVLTSVDAARPGRVDAVVVGAGFAGLYMIYKLREQGLSVQGFEAGDGVGGTWFWNRYPGARCDVPSMDYSYSFSEELQQEWVWTERFAAQSEILAYLDHVADRFGLRRHIRFSTRVVAARFDGAAEWTVSTDDGQQVRCRYLITASGNLSAAKQPEIEGLDSFAGPSFHTGSWPRAGVDFGGQRVGIIGTGSSGIQCIPAIADQAEQVTVFQRTPNFSVPARNGPLGAEEVAARKAVYAEHREQARHSTSGTPPFITGAQPGTSVDSGRRRVAWQSAWDEGSGIRLLRAFSDTMVDEEVNEDLAEFVRDRVRETVADARVAELLAPKGYPIGAKRLCLDTNYYETYNRDDVELVDLHSEPIVEVTKAGVRTAKQDYACDSLVFATGFDAMTGALDAMDITNAGGVRLKSAWAAGPRTYLGLAVAGFPNLFLITGPGSPSVLSNVVVSIEQHVEWISDCIGYLREHGVDRIEAQEQAQEDWTEHVQVVANGTLMAKGNSWYLGANVPGKPRIFMPYLGGVGAYRDRCDEIAGDHYRGFTLTKVTD